MWRSSERMVAMRRTAARPAVMVKQTLTLTLTQEKPLPLPHPRLPALHVVSGSGRRVRELEPGLAEGALARAPEQ